MKQRTSVYLDDADREAIRQIGDYYGITSDTDVCSFSVRVVARGIPPTQKAGLPMTIPTQDTTLAHRKQWQVHIYTSKDQTTPHTFYGETFVSLQGQVLEWLHSAQPTYLRSRMTYFKEDKRWRPLSTESNERVYAEFCPRGLAIQQGPEYEEQGMVDGVFQLSAVRKTVKHDNPEIVNQMLQRGWRILSLNRSDHYETTDYLLGHTEPDAF